MTRLLYTLPALLSLFALIGDSLGDTASPHEAATITEQDLQDHHNVRSNDASLTKETLRDEIFSECNSVSECEAREKSSHESVDKADEALLVDALEIADDTQITEEYDELELLASDNGAEDASGNSDDGGRNSHFDDGEYYESSVDVADDEGGNDLDEGPASETEGQDDGINDPSFPDGEEDHPLPPADDGGDSSSTGGDDFPSPTVRTNVLSTSDGDDEEGTVRTVVDAAAQQDNSDGASSGSKNKVPLREILLRLKVTSRRYCSYLRPLPIIRDIRTSSRPPF